jgi:hypothetical protein
VLAKISSKVTTAIDRLKKNDLLYFEEQFMYGHREILLNFAMQDNEKLSSESFLAAGLSHGWAPNFEVWKVRDRALRKKSRYVWNSPTQIKNFEKYRQVPIGSPWLYLLKSLGISEGKVAELPIVANRKNLIIPFHSEGHEIKSIYKQVEHYKSVVDPQETTICLFWLDFCDPLNRRIYRDAGFNLECVGYTHRVSNSYKIGQPRTFFLLNLLELMLQHRVYITDSISTSFFYAAALGKNIKLAEDEIGKEFSERFTKFVKRINDYDLKSGQEWLSSNHDLIGEGELNTHKVNSRAWQELGSRHILSAQKLSELDWKSSERIPNHIDAFSSKFDEIKSKIEIRSLTH